MANDFSGDTNCKALWRFENGALATDTIGTNTLTASGTPAADTVNYKEGAASCDFELSETDYFSIADANLDAGFPLKNGDAVGNISVCFWVKFESFTALSYNYVLEKGVSNKRSFALYVKNISGSNYRLQIGIGRNAGADYQEISHASNLAINTWYHVAASYNNATKAYYLHIWDDTAGATLGSDLSGTSTDNVNIEDAALYIGCKSGPQQYLDGLLDEVVVFSDVLILSEMNSIRAGTYASTTTLGLAGTVTAESAVSGALGITVITILSLAGTVAATSAVSGAATATTITPLGLSGTIAAQSSVMGALTVVTILSIAGTVEAVSSVWGHIARRVFAAAFPPARPAVYDEDSVWDEDTGTWGSDEGLLQAGGSRYRAQLVVVAKDLIYFEQVT